MDRVSLADEPLMFTDSDITLDNFLRDPSTRRIWLVDCQDINVLPSSFFSFYLHRWSRTDPLVRAVAAAFDFPVSEKLRLLGAAAAVVMQSGDSSFGESPTSRRVGLVLKCVVQASTKMETTHGPTPLPVPLTLRIRILVPRCQ